MSLSITHFQHVLKGMSISLFTQSARVGREQVFPSQTHRHPSHYCAVLNLYDWYLKHRETAGDARGWDFKAQQHNKKKKQGNTISTFTRKARKKGRLSVPLPEPSTRFCIRIGGKNPSYCHVISEKNKFFKWRPSGRKIYTTGEW